MAINIVRWATLRPASWKNGGGTAVDILTAPPGASVEDFDWRVNVATVARSGPFSDYPGVDRDFRVLDGGDVELAVEGSSRRTLLAGGAAYRFPGDRPTFAQLVDEAEPCRAFNVLTRRGRITRDVCELVIGSPRTLWPTGTVLVGIVQCGSIGVGPDATPERLGTLDAFVTSESVEVEPFSEARLLLVQIAEV